MERCRRQRQQGDLVLDFHPWLRNAEAFLALSYMPDSPQTVHSKESRVALQRCSSHFSTTGLQTREQTQSSETSFSSVVFSSQSQQKHFLSARLQIMHEPRVPATCLWQDVVSFGSTLNLLLWCFKTFNCKNPAFLRTSSPESTS